jgi:hypothetical protein
MIVCTYDVGTVAAVLTPNDVIENSMVFECKQSSTLLDVLFSGRAQVCNLGTFI